MHIGKSVKMALIKRGKDLKWLQVELDISHYSHVSRLAREKSTKFATVEELAEAFDLPVSEFIALGEE